MLHKILEETSSDGNFQELYERCARNGLEYDDLVFPAGPTSLINDWDDDEVMDKVSKWKNFQWLRPRDFLIGDEPQIFQN